MEKFIKLFTASLTCILIIAVCGVIYGFVIGDGLTFSYAYSANFIIGAILMAAGIVLLFLPIGISFKSNKLVDHSTYVERTKDARESKQEKAYELLYLGFLNVINAGTIQIVHWLIT
ncbi:MAG: hypothetical protein FWE29_05230 [Defluviitaleaceae bacterium]|nr:hypothetical protein [Defluviitaleaceae bacterium]